MKGEGRWETGFIPVSEWSGRGVKRRRRGSVLFFEARRSKSDEKRTSFSRRFSKATENTAALIGLATTPSATISLTCW